MCAEFARAVIGTRGPLASELPDSNCRLAALLVGRLAASFVRRPRHVTANQHRAGVSRVISVTAIAECHEAAMFPDTHIAVGMKDAWCSFFGSRRYCPLSDGGGLFGWTCMVFLCTSGRVCCTAEAGGRLWTNGRAWTVGRRRFALGGDDRNRTTGRAGP